MMATTPVLKSVWPTAHTIGTSWSRKQATGVTQIHSPAPAAIHGNVLHTEGLFHTHDPHTQGARSSSTTSGDQGSQKTSPRCTHSACISGIGGFFPSHAQMLSSLALQGFNTTDLIIIYLLHQEHK